MREINLLDTEAWFHEKSEVSTDLYLPPKLPKQNQHHSKQGYKCNQNTDEQKESKPFEKMHTL